MSLTARKKLLKKHQIQISAIKIMNHYGYEKATMEQIAAELNMTKGALYYYFKNKEDLIYQCHHIILSNGLEKLEHIASINNTATATLSALIDAHIEFVLEEKEFLNLMMEPRKTFTKEQLLPVLNLRKRYAAIFDEVIAKGITQGEFKTQNPFIARMAILGAMNWIQQWFNETGHMKKVDIQKYYRELILKILT